MTRPIVARSRLLRALGRAARRVGPGGEMVVLGTLTGAILAAGVALTQGDAPRLIATPPLALVSLEACDRSAGIGVTWGVDATQPTPPVTGLTLTGVPAPCAALPITVSLTDAQDRVIASVTHPAIAASGETDLAFVFATPQPIPPIEGLRAEVPDPAGTPVVLAPGAGVTVAFADPGSGIATAISFSQVAGAGPVIVAPVAADDPGYVPPSGFALTDPPIYFDISTGAAYEPPVDVCIYYPASALPGPDHVELLHFEAAQEAWVNTTTSWDPATGRLCGRVDSFSPFAVGLGGSATIATASTTTAAAYGELAPVVATVAGLGLAEGGYAVPSGSVAFTACLEPAGGTCPDDAWKPVATVALTDGSAGTGRARAVLPDWQPEPGVYRVRSAYLPDAGSAYGSASEASGLRVVIGRGTPVVGLRLGALTTGDAPWTSTAAGSPLLTIEVAPSAAGLVLPGGSAFLEELTTGGSLVVGECILAAGRCDVSSGTLASGTHLLRARYQGDDRWSAATSPSSQLTAGKAASATTLGVSATTVAFGRPVTFIATVTGTAATPPTGTVAFREGSRTLGSCSLDRTGRCSWTTRSLSVATHTIAGFYAGDARHLASRSRTATLVVTKASTKATTTTSDWSVRPGETVVLTARVVPAPGGSGRPTGLVRFFDGRRLVGSARLVDGIARISTRLVMGGSHLFQTYYAGDGHFIPRYGTRIWVLVR